MGKDGANRGTQQTRMDQYTAQNSGASLQKDPPGPMEKGAEPTGAQVLAAIESSSLEPHDGTGTPEALHGESSGRPRGTAEVRTAARRSTRRHCISHGGRVIVRSNGTLSFERSKQECETKLLAKLFVQTVTSETSVCSGSPCVTGRLSPEAENADT
ncbi:hypothetical protein NDU88_003469 [Pleurodeles waltl]|uniref:Uncharacterized protein n=1 Tax=Pleurodeles waltl TaxID=8319 RepID=A0AAV7Q9H5_PLEWA|nr:hypothetical protein NDU88_003469 [Pleurodeles waltl]